MKKKLLLNGFSSKAGGGKTIFDNILASLVVEDNLEVHVIFPPGVKSQRENIRQVKIPNYMYSRAFVLVFYLVFLPLYCRKYKIECCLNLGDLVLPFVRGQTYFFDWAYLVTKNSIIWESMTFKDKVSRKLKSFLIGVMMSSNKRIICQSEAMKESLVDKFGIVSEVLVLSTPVELPHSFKIDTRVRSTDFIYVSNYAPHKNFSVIPFVAQELKRNGVNTRIVLTLDKSSKEWCDLLDDIKRLSVEKYVVTLGALSNNEVYDVLKASKRLFFPSLLESYGLPILEAMSLGCVVLVSRSPYIESVCKDAAIYFDPYDVGDMAAVIGEVVDTKIDISVLQKKAADVISEIDSWEVYTKKIVNFSSK